MHRKFIALVLSASLALTGLTAQPVKADDTAEWIAGAAALAIIGLAIADANKKPQPAYNYGYGQGHSYGHTPYNYGTTHGHAGPLVSPAPTPQYHDPKVLPRQCGTKVNMQGQVIRGLGKRCLKRNGVNIQALPAYCEVKVRDPHSGKRKIIYGGRCLRQNGYSLARAH